MAEECARKSIKKLLLQENIPAAVIADFYPTCPYILLYLNKLKYTGFGGTPPMEINHAFSYVYLPIII